MASGKWQKKTIIDLYIEKEREAWYFRLIAIITASLILLGYLIFAQAFPTSSPNSSTLTIVAAVFLALGYSLSIALCPCLLACLLGTINAGLSMGIEAQPWTATSIAAIALGATSSIGYAVIALLVSRKIEYVRSHDKTSTAKGGSTENLNLISEEELQRQHLLRLLVKKEEGRSPQQTYRINIPDNAVALKTPPPLTAPIQGLGLSGTLGGPNSSYGSHNSSQSVSIGALPLEDQFAFHRGNINEEPVSSQRAALEAARERARIAKARAHPPSPRDEEDTYPYPPVIVNTRHVGDDISEIPLSERHPLERQGHIPGRASKDKEELLGSSGVYRPVSDYGGHDYDTDDHYSDEPTFEIVEGADIQVDLSKDYTRQQQQPIIRSPNPSYNPAPHSNVPGLAITSQGRESYRRSRESRYSS